MTLIGNVIDDFLSYNHLSDTQFITFKSIDEINYIIYIQDAKNIIFYNLINNEKIYEIIHFTDKGETIGGLNHIFDKYNKRDLLLAFTYGEW